MLGRDAAADGDGSDDGSCLVRHSSFFPLARTVPPEGSNLAAEDYRHGVAGCPEYSTRTVLVHIV